jgi:hypothetical protein
VSVGGCANERASKSVSVIVVKIPAGFHSLARASRDAESIVVIYGVAKYIRPPTPHLEPIWFVIILRQHQRKFSNSVRQLKPTSRPPTQQPRRVFSAYSLAGSFVSSCVMFFSQSPAALLKGLHTQATEHFVFRFGCESYFHVSTVVMTQRRQLPDHSVENQIRHQCCVLWAHLAR